MSIYSGDRRAHTPILPAASLHRVAASSAVERVCVTGKEEGRGERCLQSRVGALASTWCGNTLLSCNVARGWLGYCTASSNVLDVN